MVLYRLYYQQRLVDGAGAPPIAVKGGGCGGHRLESKVSLGSGAWDRTASTQLQGWAWGQID
jgi:hypothetical protein